jgi:hypothetical protein
MRVTPAGAGRPGENNGEALSTLSRDRKSTRGSMKKMTQSVLDCSQLSYLDMAKTVRSIRRELKRRNPIGVNFYTGNLDAAAADLEEVSAGEIANFTSECGPREKAPKGQKCATKKKS